MNLSKTILLSALVMAPVSALAQDSDGDGIANGADAYPCNSAVAAQAFAPAQGMHGMVQFEDFFNVGLDEDFNDVVLTYNYVYQNTAAGQVSQFRATINALAMGGTIEHAIGLVLPVPASSASSITVSIGGGTPVTLSPSSIDAQLTLTLTSDIRAALFADSSLMNNVVPGVSVVPSQELELIVNFAIPVDMPASGAPYDLFIKRTNVLSHEVHLNSYCGTANMDTSMFNNGDDNSDPLSGRCFVSNAGLPWALHIPELVSYPNEETSIAALYPEILNFAASGGSANQDFYLNATPTFGFSAALSPKFPGGIDNIVADVSCVPTAPPAVAEFLFDDAANLGLNTALGASSVASFSGGVAAYVDSTRGPVASFPGQSALMLLSPAVNLGTTWTLSAWFKDLYGPASWRTLYRGSSLHHPLIVEAGSTRLGGYNNQSGGFRASGHDVGGLISGWHHIVAVGAGSSTTYYLDGVQVGVSDFKSIDNVYSIGNYQGTGQVFAQYIDDVRIYDVALDSAQINAIGPMTVTAPPPPVPTGDVSCLAHLRNGATTDGLYTIDADGSGPLAAHQVYCDMTRDGGGWTLVEVGRNNGSANLLTNSGVGVIGAPDQGNSAKVSRAEMGQLLGSGDQLLRYGHPGYGLLYIGPVQNSWVVSGLGSSGYGTGVVPNVVSVSYNQVGFGGTRFAWPLNGRPQACSNTDGGTGQCGGGLHVGTWTGSFADGAYMNGSTILGGAYSALQYELWAR